jgi:hypothetical protein
MVCGNEHMTNPVAISHSKMLTVLWNQQIKQKADNSAREKGELLENYFHSSQSSVCV